MNRWRLSAGLGLEAGVRPLRALNRFAAFLHTRAITSADGIDHTVLEDYLADLQAAMGGSWQQGDHTGMIGAFLTAIRQHGWDPALPATAMLFPCDQPCRAELLPRTLARYVMTQVEQPGPREQPRLPAGHPHSQPLRPAGLRRPEAALRLHRHGR